MRRSDQIEILGLEVFAHHGVYEYERVDGQRFVLDVTLDADTHIAARTDDIADAIDYATLTTRVATLVRETRYDLLEALAARVAEELLAWPGVSAATVRVHKPDVELGERVMAVAVTVHRARPTHLT